MWPVELWAERGCVVQAQRPIHKGLVPRVDPSSNRMNGSSPFRGLPLDTCRKCWLKFGRRFRGGLPIIPSLLEVLGLGRSGSTLYDGAVLKATVCWTVRPPGSKRADQASWNS